MPRVRLPGTELRAQVRVERGDRFRAGAAATVSYVIVILVAILSFLQFFAARERKA